MPRGRRADEGGDEVLEQDTSGEDGRAAGVEGEAPRGVAPRAAGPMMGGAQGIHATERRRVSLESFVESARRRGARSVRGALFGVRR